MRTEGQGNDGQENETTGAGPRVGRCGLPGPHSLAQHSPPRRPTRSQMPTACPWDGYVRRYVSEAIVHPSRGQRRSRRCPAERKGRGGGRL